MIKRVLVLASVASMIDQFNMPNIKLLQNMGFKVDVACNFIDGSTCSDEKIKQLKETLNKMGVSYYQIDFARNITHIGSNVRAYKQVKTLLKKNSYEFLHCHSPIGGVVGRLAGKSTKTKVIYTAHGFHFYKGAPVKNKIIYYPIEKICSRMTDVLICINKEDYNLAHKKMKAKKVVYVPGVGVDLAKFEVDSNLNNSKREEIGVPSDKLWVLTVGELIVRKNHENLIKAVSTLDNIYLTIAGKGELKDYYEKMIKELGVQDRVKLLGFRTDISDLCKSADLFAFPSYQEGLPVALMEAMACGKAVVCSKIRGNTDLIEDNKGGYLFDPHSSDQIRDAIEKASLSNRSQMGEFNRVKIKQFGLTEVLTCLQSIYANID